MKMNVKTYQTPDVDVINVGESDILTMSSGFDGEYHKFSLSI